MRPVPVTDSGTNNSETEYSMGMQENDGRPGGEWERQEGSWVYRIKHQETL